MLILTEFHCEVASEIPSNKRQHKSLYNWAFFYSKEERTSTFSPVPGPAVGPLLVPPEGNLAQDEVFVVPRWSALQILTCLPVALFLCGIDRGLA